MIFIVVKWPVKPEHADDWMSVASDFTQATRSEPGCRFFDWSRSVEDPNQWVLVEGFADGDAGGKHVNSDHFKAAQAQLPDYLSATPKVISQSIDTDDWSELGEMPVRS